jgi:hypothetical protein
VNTPNDPRERTNGWGKRQWYSLCYRRHPDGRIEYFSPTYLRWAEWTGYDLCPPNHGQYSDVELSWESTWCEPTEEQQT